VIDSILNLMFRCSHRRLTRPVSRATRAGEPHGQAYVVCLDCGKQFAYDVKEMKIGKALDGSHEHGVIPPGMPRPQHEKMRLALWASVPLALFAGALLRGPKRGKPKPPATGAKPPAKDKE
jgi:hypothetical protein